ncbi:MAG: kinesin, partial [Acidobacteria bacterium]
MANFKTIWKMVAVVCVVLWPPLAGADDKTWKMHTEAGEEAYRQGNLTEAEKEFREARKETDALAFPDQRQAVSLENLARLYCLQGKYGQAEGLYWQVLTIREKILGATHPDLAAAFNNLALIYFAEQHYHEAERFYLRALTIWEKTQGAETCAFATGLS